MPTFSVFAERDRVEGRWASRRRDVRAGETLKRNCASAQKYKTFSTKERARALRALPRSAITFFSSTSRFRLFLYLPSTHPAPPPLPPLCAVPYRRRRATDNKSSYSGNFLRGTSFLPQSNDLLNTSFLYSITVLFTFRTRRARARFRIVSVQRLRNEKNK